MRCNVSLGLIVTNAVLSLAQYWNSGKKTALLTSTLLWEKQLVESACSLDQLFPPSREIISWEIQKMNPELLCWWRQKDMEKPSVPCTHRGSAGGGCVYLPWHFHLSAPLRNTRAHWWSHTERVSLLGYWAFLDIPLSLFFHKQIRCWMFRRKGWLEEWTPLLKLVEWFPSRLCKPM